MSGPKALLERIKRFFRQRTMQFTISISFALITAVAMAATGVFLYQSYNRAAQELLMENNGQLVDQVDRNLSTYLRNMMRISDALYYNVIKSVDAQEDSMEAELNLLYEANRDSLISLACFTADGELVGAAPLENLKKGVEVTAQDWFLRASGKLENLHFSNSHVQNLFEVSNDRFYWVISLSRGVELTSGGEVESGILLVDMDFSGVEQLFSKANNQEMSYMYLIGEEGEIIYHPRQNLVFSNLLGENNQTAAGYEDGVHRETYQGEERMVLVKTVGYTGWKIVSVTPMENFYSHLSPARITAMVIVVVAILIMILVNYFVSTLVSQPLKRLEASVKKMEGLKEPKIYIGGSHEIQHLGRTITAMVEKQQELTEGLVREQEEKRKGELDALQSQINPHFLYNTLDSIMWMIESGHYDDAISMVDSLASLFRISLSKGKNIISVGEELRHARHYLEIQKYRYKNKFQVFFQTEEGVEAYRTVKLILQPLVENAIYYGMEAMDGDGEIHIRAYTREETVLLEVEDNGLGILEEQLEHLLTDDTRSRSRGSGIGLRNIQQRIQLHFGEDYGLEIISEPDEGTLVRIRLPKLTEEPRPSRGGDHREKN